MRGRGARCVASASDMSPRRNDVSGRGQVFREQDGDFNSQESSVVNACDPIFSMKSNQLLDSQYSWSSSQTKIKSFSKMLSIRTNSDHFLSHQATLCHRPSSQKHNLFCRRFRFGDSDLQISHVPCFLPSGQAHHHRPQNRSFHSTPSLPAASHYDTLG